ncbi:MAG: DUF3604 domain-containing protein [Candidatus Hodarchaeales archaeon]|jgi:hypothetical protein
MQVGAFLDDKRVDLTLRVVKIILYCFGVLTLPLYYFNLIGLVIGVFYFIFFTDYWRKHGFVLAFSISISSFLTIITKGNIIYPLYLALISGWGTLALYFLSLTLVSVIIRRSSGFSESINTIDQQFANMSRWGRISILIIIILTPILLWSSVSVNIFVILDNNPRLLWINAPTTVNTSTPFTVTVEAWDAFERVSALYEGTVDFSIKSHNLSTFELLSSTSCILPEAYTFTSNQMFGSDIAYNINDGNDNGLHLFEVTIDTPGIHYLLVEDSLTGNTYYSNPIVCCSLMAEDDRIYWGDIHGHSYLSDGSGTADHAYYYARNVARVDFASLTDHGEILSFVFNGLDMLEQTTNDAYDPGSFVTFHGIEYTNHETGHFSCIFSGNELLKDPLISSYAGVGTPFDLWDILDDYTTRTSNRVLALPHHTVKERYMQDWTYYDPEYVKLAEVSSVHGENLFTANHPLNYRGSTDPPPVLTNGSSIMDALRMGLRLTLYGSGDTHDGHFGHAISHTNAYVGHQTPWTTWYTRCDKPYPSAITACLAPALTRQSIFGALENRKVYANSDNGRPYIDFTINGLGISSGNTTIMVDNTTVSREIKVVLAQDGAPVARKITPVSVTKDWVPDWNCHVEIFKNGELLSSIEVNDAVDEVTYTDSSPIVGANYGRESSIQREGNWYINEYSDNSADPDTLNTNGIDFYLIRIVGRNGRTSFIGPIWVQATN